MINKIYKSNNLDTQCVQEKKHNMTLCNNNINRVHDMFINSNNEK